MDHDSLRRRLHYLLSNSIKCLQSSNLIRSNKIYANDISAASFLHFFLCLFFFDSNTRIIRFCCWKFQESRSHIGGAARALPRKLTKVSSVGVQPELST